jgi:hypothetical protein
MIHNIPLEYDKINIKQKLGHFNDFTFIPLKYDNNDIVIQTPKLFIPFNISKFRDKKYLDLSFQNIKNDKNIKLFYENILLIHEKINKVLKKYEITKIFKEYNKNILLRLKVLDNTSFFDHNKNRIYNIENLTYGEFIIHLQGLWLIDNKISFNLILLQAKVDMPLYLDKYAFIDGDGGNVVEKGGGKEKGKGKGKAPPPPPIEKHKHLIKLGISKEAIEHKEKMIKPFNTITTDDLLSIKLKKTIIEERKHEDEFLIELKKKILNFNI